MSRRSRRRRKTKGGGYCSDLIESKKKLSRKYGQSAHGHLSRTQRLGYQACRLIFARKSFADYRRFRKNILSSEGVAPLIVQTTLDAVKESPYTTTDQKSYVTALSKTGASLHQNTDLYQKKDISKAQYVDNQKDLTKTFEKTVLSIPDSAKTSVHKLLSDTTKMITPKLPHDDKIAKTELKKKIKKSVKFALENTFRKILKDSSWADNAEMKEEMAPVDYIVHKGNKHNRPLTASDLEQRILQRRQQTMVHPLHKYDDTMRKVDEEERIIIEAANSPSFVNSHPNLNERERYDNVSETFARSRKRFRQ